jgi:hypothetical protein
MHALAVVIIPFDASRANIRPTAARDAAVGARIDTLLFRYEQPDEQAWGVSHARGFKFDWCSIGGRWKNWGREIRGLMKAQRRRSSRLSIPRVVERNAAWSEDLVQVRMTSFALLPIAVITPHGEWEECRGNWGLGKPTTRERRFKAAWIRRLRTLMRAYPSCLVIAVDYHF